MGYGQMRKCPALLFIICLPIYPSLRHRIEGINNKIDVVLMITQPFSFYCTSTYLNRLRTSMRYLISSTIWSLTVLSSCLTASPSSTRSSASLSLQFPQHPSSEPNHAGRPILSRIKDNIVRILWDSPSILSNSPAIKLSTPIPKPPSKLLGRYGGDVVLRFKIKSAEEAEALVEATKVLFLDVWEFTPEWVDIRLSKDVVWSSLVSVLMPIAHPLGTVSFRSPSAFSSIFPLSVDT